jgi:hypothetical protein
VFVFPSIGTDGFGDLALARARWATNVALRNRRFVSSDRSARPKAV